MNSVAPPGVPLVPADRTVRAALPQLYTFYTNWPSAR